MYDFGTYRASAWTLIGANLIPLVGVLFWGWSTFEVVVLYWAENVVLGIINVLKMLACRPDPEQIELDLLGSGPQAQAVRKAAQKMRHGERSQGFEFVGALFLSAFFTFHYGMFCAVHGVFVFALLGDNSPLRGGTAGFGPTEFLRSELTPYLAFAFGGLAISHLVSFFANYIGRREYQRTVLPALMIQPYGRIVVLHLAIIFGAFALVLLDSPVFLLVILIAGKTLLDLKLHLRERRRNAAAAENPGMKADLGTAT